MPEITFPITVSYALASKEMCQFNELTFAEYSLLLNAANSRDILKEAQFCPLISIPDELQKKRVELCQNAEQYDKHYVIALNKWEKFKQQHKNIFDQGEQIRDSDDPRSLLDMLLGRSEQDVKARFFAKHKKIYDELKRLYADVARWEPHSKRMLNKRIEQETSNLEGKLTYTERKAREKWDQERLEKLKKSNNELKFATGYEYIVHDIKIEYCGLQTTITGWRRQCWKKDTLHPFNITFINQSIQIIR